MELSPSEKAFLDARKTEQADLGSRIKMAEKQISTVSEEYDAIQPQIEALRARQIQLGEKKQELIEKHDLINVKNQYSAVSLDVTKLLRKQRGA